jgi:putative membrane protein
MMNYDANYWNAGWGWFLWFGVIILVFSNIGSWGYTYRTNKFNRNDLVKDSTDILNERYARGDINREEFHKMKVEIIEHRSLADRRSSKNLKAQTN